MPCIDLSSSHDTQLSRYGTHDVIRWAVTIAYITLRTAATFIPYVSGICGWSFMALPFSRPAFCVVGVSKNNHLSEILF